ncbi:MAG: triose-phosphate isomerase [Polyangiaceae bacterium]|nr:triose-phosphate isomerase [Polyangiaceae bacterium]
MAKLRTPLIVGNWKMNQGGTTARILAAEVCHLTPDCRLVEIVVCPPFTAVAAVAEEMRHTHVQVGAQNVNVKASGAHTGEVSIGMLADSGATWVILGHSERRASYGDTDALVAAKTRVVLDAGLRPIVCVGETLDEREQGLTLEVVRRQLNAFVSILADKPGVGAVAYEPVWAIGTGKTAQPSQAQEVHAMIRAQLGSISAESAGSTRILYGGSMNTSNVMGLLACEDVDGGLIGGASLVAEDFAKLATSAQYIWA